MKITIRKVGTFRETVQVHGDAAGINALHAACSSALVQAALHPAEDVTVHVEPDGLGESIEVKVIA